MQPRALIVVAGASGHTMQLARALGQRLRRHGHRVDIADPGSETAARPTEYEAVIFGAEAGHARDRRTIGDYIARYRAPLSCMTTGLFLVAGARHRDARRHVEAFASSISWQPSFYATLAVPNRVYLCATAQHVLGTVLGALLGSKDVSTRGDVTELADSIVHELARAGALRGSRYARTLPDERWCHGRDS